MGSYGSTKKNKRHGQENNFLGLLTARSTYTRRSSRLDSGKNPDDNPDENPAWYG